MRGLAEIEVLVLVAAGATALYFLIMGGMAGNSLEMLGGLVGYVVVWIYALVRASYSGPAFS